MGYVEVPIHLTLLRNNADITIYHICWLSPPVSNIVDITFQGKRARVFRANQHLNRSRRPITYIGYLETVWTIAREGETGCPNLRLTICLKINIHYKWEIYFDVFSLWNVQTQ